MQLDAKDDEDAFYKPPIIPTFSNPAKGEASGDSKIPKSTVGDAPDRE